MTDEAPSSEVVARLAAWFRRNGYVRLQKASRMAEPYGSYKKGDEVRLVAGSLAELGEMKVALRAVGFAPGKPFVKADQWRLPVYGRTEVVRFLTLIGEPVPTPAATPIRRGRKPGRPRKGSPPPAAPIKRPRKNAPPARIIRLSAKGPLVIPDFEGERPA